MSNASGDDEELKWDCGCRSACCCEKPADELQEALDRYFQATIAYHRWREPDIEDSQARAIEMGDARQAVESLFGRIREELKEALVEVDRLHALSLRLRA